MLCVACHLFVHAHLEAAVLPVHVRHIHTERSEKERGNPATAPSSDPTRAVRTRRQRTKAERDPLLHPPRLHCRNSPSRLADTSPWRLNRIAAITEISFSASSKKLMFGVSGLALSKPQ